jgi:hypothetical protein
VSFRWRSGGPALAKRPSRRRPVKPLVSLENLYESVELFYPIASPREQRALQLHYFGFQENLTAFAVVYSLDLPDQERAIVLSVFTVMAYAFLESGAGFRTIRFGEVRHAWRASAAFVRDLRSHGEPGVTSEPEVVRYFLNVLMPRGFADLEPESPPMVAARILKVVVDCLHRSCIRPPDRPPVRRGLWRRSRRWMRLPRGLRPPVVRRRGRS